MNNIVFLNGQFLPSNKATVSIFDRGFLYGDGLFETLRSYKGKPFALGLHLQRLCEGCRTIGIPLKLNKKYLFQCIYKLLKSNGLLKTDAYIRLTVTRGVDYGSLAPFALSKPTVAIIVKPLHEKIGQYQQKGIRAIFLNNRRSLPHIKSLNLLLNITGMMEAHKRKAQEGIFTDGNKILEGTITNIFISDGNGIKTPPVSDGILPGITRRLVIEIAKRERIKVTEASLTKGELKSCREAFLTNSIMEIAPLVKMENKLIGTGQVGAFTRRFQQEYKHMPLKQIIP